MSLAENIAFLSRLPKPGSWPVRGMGEAKSPLSEIRDFGSNPGELRMFAFVPTKLQRPRALVVVLHGCGQTAAGYDLGAGWSTLAKHYGFALLMPQQQSANNAGGCFNWFNRDDIVRGRGEACSIHQMIEHLVHDHDIDPRRIFITGLSAGGGMTSVMLSTYPDVFAAGAIIAGVPFGVASNMRDALSVMRGFDQRPARALGDLVRNATRHEGSFPRVSVWHGSSDFTVHPNNAREIVKQWLDVHQLPDAPMAETVVDGHPRQVWWGPDGETIVESYSIANMAHGTPLGRGDDDKRYGRKGAFLLDVGISSSYHIAKFFGLTHWIRDAKPAPADSPSTKLIPAVSLMAAPERAPAERALTAEPATSNPVSIDLQRATPRAQARSAAVPPRLTKPALALARSRGMRERLKDLLVRLLVRAGLLRGR